MSDKKKIKAKSKGGAPTKYKKEYCKGVIDYLSKGKSITQYASSLMVHKDTVYEWAKVHLEFSDALKLGRQLSEAYWQDKLADDMYDTSINSPLYKLYFANRFGWSDKVETKNETASVDKVKSFSDMYG